jgi:serine phosphatase RsbU (regulator of sigma subunit)
MNRVSRFKEWWGRLVAPTNVGEELAWRGYVLNTLLLGLILFTTLLFVINVFNAFLGLDDGTALLSITAVAVFVFLYWLSRAKSVRVAIFIFSIMFVIFSFALSIGWGVSDIATTAIYVVAITQTSLLLRRWRFALILSILLAGYVFFGIAELGGWFTPLFFTELPANFVNVTILLIFITFVSYTASRLIDQVLAAQVAEAARRQELESRTKIAAEVQMSMLPARAPAYAGFDIAGRSIPARDVGGDFYNYHQLATGELAIIIGDVTGKGMSAALLMAVTTGMIESLIPTTAKPTDLLKITAARLEKHSQRSGLNAACLAAYLKEDGTLCVANAGCIAPAIRRNGSGVEWLNVQGLPMGVDSELTHYEQVETVLGPGDLVIFTTDGVVETQNADRKILGFDRLETIISSGPTVSAYAMQTYILDQVQAYQNSTEQADDITVIVIQVKDDLFVV